MFNLSDDKKELISCEYLTPNMSIPDGVEVIGRYAFYPSNINDRWIVQEVFLPNTIKVIKKSAFSENMNLKHINLPNSIEIIEEDAFSECRNLDSINIPTSISVLEKGVFGGCRSVKSLHIPPSVTIIRELSLCDMDFKDIYIPEGVRSIERGVFMLCPRLEEIFLPSSLEYLDSDAFDRCYSSLVSTKKS